MRDIITVFRKEIHSILVNKTILSQVLIVPFVLIFGFSMLLSFQLSDMEQSENKKLEECYVVHAPDVFKEAFETIGVRNMSSSDIESTKDQIKDGDRNLLIVFPENFELTDDMSNLSNIEIWHDPSRTDSSLAYNVVIAALDSVRPVVFTINVNDPESYLLNDEPDPISMLLSLLFPMYSVMAIFMITMAIAAESIVGEKERGFMNMLLIAPVKRTSIAFGKLLSILCVNVIGGISAIFGMISALTLMKVLDLGSIPSFPYGSLFLLALTTSFSLTWIDARLMNEMSFRSFVMISRVF